MPPVGKKSTKTVYKTGIPFTETKWPLISNEDTDVITDLLYNLLEPIRIYRELHTPPSKGKKRKRSSPKSSSNDAENTDTGPPPPPPPELSRHILVGLNSCTRHLSALAARSAPATQPAAQQTRLDAQTQPEATCTKATNPNPETATKESTSSEGKQTDPNSELKPLSMLILPHPHPPSSLPHAHLPTLVYLASLPPHPSHPGPDRSTASSKPSTRLVTLFTVSELRLASILQIPRVGAIGILEGAPGAEPLIEYARANVGEVECKWIEESLSGSWRGIKLDEVM